MEISTSLLLILAIFFIGYLFITIEHQIKVDKTISALVMASLSWVVLKTFNATVYEVTNGLEPMYLEITDKLGISQQEANLQAIDTVLLKNVGKIAEILFFLIGAMTIVEIVDMHRGFEIIKKVVKTTDKRKLLWILGVIAFFVSALIDNLTTVIVIITILRKLIPDKKERMYYAALSVIASNAGGAWSPVGDVTTTMLWMGNKVTVGKLVEYIFIPAVLSFVIPYAIASFLPVFKGKVNTDVKNQVKMYSSSVPMFAIGMLAIVFVPVFKSITHLPPYMGMLLSLGVVWFFSEFLKPEKELDEELKPHFGVHRALSRIEISSVLFFLGILLAVAALEVTGMLFNFAKWLEVAIPNRNIVITLLGVASSVIDNVPLVAASMGMFQEAMDSFVWHFIAFSAGTGGSMLIIGSAAGVAAMGMEKIEFFWYLKNISWMALLGFLAGCVSTVMLESVHLFG